jgi:hypothetical protein
MTLRVTKYCLMTLSIILFEDNQHNNIQHNRFHSVIMLLSVAIFTIMLSVVRPSVTYFATPTVVMISVVAPQRCDRRELPGEEKGKTEWLGEMEMLEREGGR